MPKTNKRSRISFDKKLKDVYKEGRTFVFTRISQNSNDPEWEDTYFTQLKQKKSSKFYE